MYYMIVPATEPPNVDECVSQPCQNGATCIDGDDMYTCVCTTGFVGTNCEESKLFYDISCTGLIVEPFHISNYLYKER